MRHLVSVQRRAVITSLDMDTGVAKHLLQRSLGAINTIV